MRRSLAAVPSSPILPCNLSVQKRCNLLLKLTHVIINTMQKLYIKAARENHQASGGFFNVKNKEVITCLRQSRPEDK